MILQIFLLGPFRLKVGDLEISNSQWKKRKAKLLVQILALHPLHELHNEELIEILFPEIEIKKARANLSRILYAARQALRSVHKEQSPDFILTEGQQIKLNSEQQLITDVEEFEQKAASGLKTNNRTLLEEAINFYRGDLLADEPFENWTTNRRQELSVLAHRVLKRLAEISETEANLDSAHYWLDRILAREAADELSHRAKMRLYEKQQETFLSLKQYEKCRQSLKHELGVEPELETTRLYQKILAKNRFEK